MRARTAAALLALVLVLGTTSPASALHILFYYNSLDGSGGTVPKCAAILRDAGHTVTLRDVRGRSYDPTRDDWGAPYDQVWDLRFVNEESTRCGSGRTTSADYFTPAWRAKAVSFLGHCGKLFLAAENCQLTNRDEGIYVFLKEGGAVGPGFKVCAPSREGNNITDGPAFYPVRAGFGPISFFGALCGGIPLQSLRGTSFVDSFNDWEGDSTDRSIACGWTGGQLGGQVEGPDCARGRLFMVWDASMWPLLYREGVAQEWEIDLLAGRDFTRRFFPAVVRWLGKRDCPCRPVPRPSATPTPLRIVQARLSPTPTVPAPRVRPTLAPAPSLSRAETLTFREPPVNVRVRFLDGPGVYRLEVYDAKGVWLRTLLDRTVVAEKETWTTWDGLDAWGRAHRPGLYFAQLSKEGRPIHRILLNWVENAGR